MKNKLKKISLIGLSILLIFLCLPNAVFAQNQTQKKTNVTLTSCYIGKDDTYNKSLFFKTYTSFENNGNINGNVISYSSSFVNNGNISENIIGISPDSVINGKVNKSLIGYFESLTLKDSTIGSNLNIFSNNFYSDKNTLVKGDAFIYGSKVELKGVYNNDVTVVAKDVTINGVIKGKLNISADNIVLGNDARVEKDLSYDSDNLIVKGKGATIKADVTKKDLGYGKVADESSISSTANMFKTYFSTLAKICALLFGFVCFKLFPVSAYEIEIFTRKNVFKCIWVGALAYILAVPILFILLFSVLGMPFAFHLIAFLYNISFIAIIPASLCIGGFIIRKYGSLYSKSALGVLLILGLSILPLGYIGSLLSILVQFLGLGSILMLIFIFIKYQSKKEKTEKIALTQIYESKDDILKTINKLVDKVGNKEGEDDEQD